MNSSTLPAARLATVEAARPQATFARTPDGDYLAAGTSSEERATGALDGHPFHYHATGGGAHLEVYADPTSIRPTHVSHLARHADREVLIALIDTLAPVDLLEQP